MDWLKRFVQLFKLSLRDFLTLALIVVTGLMIWSLVEALSN
jgi:hypothetical protein